MSKNTKHLVAVYGTLRKGGSNHRIISNGKYIGSFESKPIFNMYSIGRSYPAIKLGGTTSVIFEVYEVTNNLLLALDELEDYDPKRTKFNLYDRKTIYTPYGEVYFYVYQMNTTAYSKIESGDWLEFVKSQPKVTLQATT